MNSIDHLILKQTLQDEVDRLEVTDMRDKAEFILNTLAFGMTLLDDDERGPVWQSVLEQVPAAVTELMRSKQVLRPSRVKPPA